MHKGTDKLSGACEVHRIKMMNFLDSLTQAKVPVLIVRCWSSMEDQMKIYEKGREFDKVSNTWKVVGPVVTKALPGHSAHNVINIDYNTPASCGTDIIPIDSKGSPLWNYPLEKWKGIIYPLAGRCGLDAYGDPWGRYLGYDLGHFEEPAWDTILSAMNLKKPITDVSKEV